MIYRTVKILLVFLGLIILGVYREYNPEQVSFFPRCIFLTVTGYRCPGCGSQRALHYLLNLDIQGAFRNNALLVLSIPYILAGLYLEYKSMPGPLVLSLRKLLLGSNAIRIILCSIIAFWVLRNVPYFGTGF